nr:unnamed protein product [Spirometra erinaceieuropaei]
MLRQLRGSSLLDWIDEDRLQKNDSSMATSVRVLSDKKGYSSATVQGARGSKVERFSLPLAVVPVVRHGVDGLHTSAASGTN